MIRPLDMVELENPPAQFLQAFMSLAVEDYCQLLNQGTISEIQGLPHAEDPPHPMTIEEMWATALMFHDVSGLVKLLRLMDPEMSESEFFERLNYARKR